MARVARLGIEIDSSGARRGAAEVKQSMLTMEGAATRAADGIRTAAVAIGVSLAGIGFAVVLKQAQEFEKQIALVSTVMDRATGSTVVFRKQLVDMFRALPVGSMDDLSKGLYDIISAGIPAGEAMAYLGVAAKASIAGVTTTATAVDALTTATNAWRLSGLSVQDASDQMFMAVNKGKMTFEQLASAIGTIAPVAAGYGVSLEDVLGATAQLTLGGLTASEAMIGIRSAITNIINPTGKLAQEFPALAKEFNATKLEAVGFTQFLVEFNKAAGGSKEAINALFSDVQGKTAVFSLLADGGRAAAEQVANVGNASGETGKAFEKLNETSAAAAQRLRNNLTATMLQLGQQALPLVNVAMGTLNGMLEFVRDNGPAIAGVVTALGSAWALYAFHTRAAALWTGIVAAAQTVQAFVQLALTIRKAADAAALFSMVTGGAAKAAIAIAAIVAGVAAYKIAANVMERETKKFNDELERTAKTAAAMPTAPIVPPPKLPPTPLAGAGGDDDKRTMAERAKEAQEAWTKEAEKTANQMRAILGVLEDANDRTATVGAQWVSLRADVDRDRAAVARATAERKKAVEEMIAEQEFELGLVGRTKLEVEKLRDAERERVLVAQGFSVAQAQTYVANERAQQRAKNATTEWADTLRDMIGVAQLLGQAFGEVGRTIAEIGTGAQSIVSGLERAASIKNSAGNKVSLGGALSGAAGATGFVSGLGAVGAVVGGVAQIADALDLFGKKAKERAREMAEAAATFNRALEDFAITSRTSLDEALRANMARARDLAAQAGKATGVTLGTAGISSVADIETLIADARAAASVKNKMVADAFKPFLAEMERLLVVTKANEEALRARNAAELERLATEREAADAIARRTQADERRNFEQDVTARTQTLGGDERGAFATRLGMANDDALAKAWALVEAGTITEEMFSNLARVIGRETVDALAAFDAAMARAKQQVQDDIAVRTLVAQGLTKEAEQRRVEIANRDELAGITDEAVRGQIIYLQGLEAEARVKAVVAEQARVVAEQNASIDARMIEAYRTLDPIKARELERKALEVARDVEIAAAADAATAARLRELYAMQDAAVAAISLADALAKQKVQAEALASFSQSIGVQYLRATGRTFDADVSELTEWRDAQLQNSKNLGAGADVIAQINAIFDSKYTALIAGTMKTQQAVAATDTPVVRAGAATFDSNTSDERIPTLGEDTTAVRSARSISEASALQLVDYASSQLAVQRRILAVLEGGKGEAASFAGASALGLDRVLGARATTTALLLNGVVV